MAMALDIEDVKRTDDLLVWPEDIIVDWKTSGRFSKVNNSDVEDLAKKILAQGQLQSVGCRRGADKKLYLSFGFRRYTAIKLINEKLQPENPIRIRVRAFDGNEVDAFEKNITENRDRKSVTVLDDANNQKILRERFQWTDEKIAEFYGCTVAYIGQLAQILLLCDPVKKSIQDGLIAPTAALKMAQQRLSEDEQVKLLGSLTEGIASVGSGKKRRVSTSQVEDGIRAQREESGQGSAPSRRVSHIKKYFSEILDCEDEPEAIKNFAEVFLEWIAGSKTDKQLANAIAKLKE